MIKPEPFDDLGMYTGVITRPASPEPTFDASRVFDNEPLPIGTANILTSRLNLLANNKGALLGIRSNVEAELRVLVHEVNWRVWGPGFSLHAPTAGAARRLRQQFSEKDRPAIEGGYRDGANFERAAKRARDRRFIIAEVDRLLAELDARVRGVDARQADEEEHKAELAAFEAHEAAEKSKRFDAWRSQRVASG